MERGERSFAAHEAQKGEKTGQVDTRDLQLATHIVETAVQAGRLIDDKMRDELLSVPEMTEAQEAAIMRIVTNYVLEVERFVSWELRSRFNISNDATDLALSRVFGTSKPDERPPEANVDDKERGH